MTGHDTQPKWASIQHEHAGLRKLLDDVRQATQETGSSTRLLEVLQSFWIFQLRRSHTLR